MTGRRKSPWVRQHSAGGVVVRSGEAGSDFLAIKPAHRDGWRLPKGTIDPGETPQQAAVREVREEGGVDATIIAELQPIQFFYQSGGRRYVKTVDFYLMSYDSGSPDDHDHEVQEARWFPLTDETVLAFPTERSLVRLARETFGDMQLTLTG